MVFLWFTSMVNNFFDDLPCKGRGVTNLGIYGRRGDLRDGWWVDVCNQRTIHKYRGR